MADKVSKEHIVIYDNGLFCSVAECFAKAGYPTSYFVPWENRAPRSNLRRIGQGYPGVARLDHPWEAFDDTDAVIVFTDVYSGALQVRERDIHGKKVWGAGLGEELELLREDTKAYMKEYGVAVGPWEQIIGIDALRDYLKTHKDVYVKNNVRGDFESFCSPNYVEGKPHCDKAQYDLGPLADTYAFIVEKKIDDAVEIALDLHCVDGQFPTKGLVSIEVKDKAYVGHFTSSGYWPQPLKELYSKFSETLKEYRYRQMFAVEARITKNGTAYMLDPCCRFGSPVSEAEQVIYSNLPEMIVAGANGEMIDPKVVEEDGEPMRWIAELCLGTSWVLKGWVPVWYPKEIAPCVKLHNAFIQDGQPWIVPSPGSDFTSIGAVVALGRSMKEAMDRCLEYAEQVRAPGLEYDPSAFQEAEKELDKLASFGMRL